ncbi:hypothetical protein FD755_000956 [Muntiacus reevesi]|uniref:Retroviral envelope protein GP41-like domain-containing protein n=1 Tax=Muntiacus reevesi TaxID=9886 RepID=A0A5J5N5Z3_MUNRE|nr:hypothetical protein FD755_000956 [Muntiacus reevesi]
MPLHSELWRISAAFQLITAWKGQFNSTVSSHSLCFDKNSTHWIKACVSLPFIFLIGPTFYNASCGLLTCQNCSFHTCINSSLQFHNDYSVYILKTRSGVWLPLKMNRPWQDSPTVYIVEEILKKVLKHTKQFIGWLIAAILGITAVATIAAVAGVALDQSGQTMYFVQEWHRDSDVLWSTPRQIDGKLAAQMADLQQAVVILLGDQCDWNTTSFCVTSHKYSESSFHWDRVKQHLLNQSNLSLDINNLEQEIMETFSQKLHLLHGSNLLEAVADGISQLNPIPQLKTIGGSVAVFMLFFMSFFLFLHSLVANHQETKQTKTKKQTKPLKPPI